MATPIKLCADYQRLNDAATAATDRVRSLERERLEALRSIQLESAHQIDALLIGAKSTARAEIDSLDRHASEHGCAPPSESPDV